MKTIKITAALFVMAFSLMAIVSCEKTDQSGTTGGSDIYATNGSIQDLGINSDSIRVIKSVITSQDFIHSNLYTNMYGKGALINARFFSNTDGELPAGNYTCSNYADKLPFTFADATVEFPAKSGLQGVFTIIDGSVSVSHEQSRYVLLFNGVLSNGENFTANYNGTLNYSDNHQ